MSKIPGVNHLDAVRALQKAGFSIARQGKHIVMSNGTRILTIPRHNPVNAFTLGGIVRDAGLTVEQFRDLLRNKRGHSEFSRVTMGGLWEEISMSIYILL
ncbi:MAG: type II toxin-antitoxin system HicA family toxin [Nitrospira sp.]|nr:type II toxin-antitoxin system HicA family toxin [Nitrospira sp.]